MSRDEVTPARPSIAESSRWVLIGTVLTKPMQLATNVMLARFLGPAAFGTLNLANLTALTIGGIAGLGMGEASNKFMAENFRRDRAAARQIVTLIVWLCFALACVVFGAAWIARSSWESLVFGDAGNSRLLVLCLTLGFVNLAYSLVVNLFTGMQSFRDVTTLSILQAFLVLGLALPLGYFYGVNGALMGSILGSIACTAWAALRLRNVDPYLVAAPRGIVLTRLAEVLHFSLPAWLSVFVINPVNLFAFSYLASQHGSNELGMFNTANGLKTLVAMLPGLIGAAIGPAILEEAGRHGRPQALESLLDNAFAALAFLTLPLTILLVFLSDVVFLIYGRAFSGSFELFMPLAAGVAATVLCGPLQFVLAARNQNWLLMGLGVVKSFLLLLLAVWWIPHGLSAGLAWATFAADVSFSILVVECCIGLKFAPRKAAGFFYRYLMVALVALCVAILASALWRWGLALPLSLLAALFIIRRHPSVAVWIAGAMPAALKRPVDHFLTKLSGSSAR